MKKKGELSLTSFFDYIPVFLDKFKAQTSGKIAFFLTVLYKI